MITILVIYSIFSYFFTFALYVRNRVSKWDVILSPVTVPFTFAAIVDYLSKVKPKEERVSLEKELLQFTNQDQLNNFNELLADINEYLVLRDLYKGQDAEVNSVCAEKLIKKYKIYKYEPVI